MTRGLRPPDAAADDEPADKEDTDTGPEGSRAGSEWAGHEDGREE